MLPPIDVEGLDFFDFGGSVGGSYQFAKRHLSGQRGVAIDLNPRKVQQMRQVGIEAWVHDMTDTGLPANSSRFVTMMHVLEHLPSLEHVRLAVAEAARIARAFLYISGPFFDADEVLAEQGLKLYFSDWSGHKTHLTTVQLQQILRELGLVDYRFFVRRRLTDSMADALHPLASARNQQRYDAARHPPKPSLELGVPVWEEMICCVRLSRCPEWPEVLNARRGTEPFDPTPDPGLLRKGRLALRKLAWRARSRLLAA
ncbi:MAG: class I SAM-dependent methyltransferase [Myxococcota bacterium]